MTVPESRRRRRPAWSARGRIRRGPCGLHGRRRSRAAGNGGDLISGATCGRRAGKFGGALSFNGTSAWVTVADDAASLDLTTGHDGRSVGRGRRSPTHGRRSVVMKEAARRTSPTALYSGNANANASRRRRSTCAARQRASPPMARPPWPAGGMELTSADDLRRDDPCAAVRQRRRRCGPSPPPSGAITSARAAPLRIGGNSVWGEYFTGLIDEVRIYNRALTPSEVQNDMIRSIALDVELPPTVTAKTPVAGTAGVNVGVAATTTFNETMSASSITSSTFLLKDSSNASVPTNVTYNSSTNVATLTPQSALPSGQAPRSHRQRHPGPRGNPLPGAVFYLVVPDPRHRRRC